MARPRQPERAVSRFEALFVPEPNSGCWLWTAALGRDGYGRFARNGRNSIVQAPRMSWELYRGPIPEGMFVLHKCDVKMCVNPDHLFIGTHLDNMKDCAAKGRHWLTVAPWRALRGAAHPKAKLSIKDATRIRDLHEVGISRASLARQFNVDWSTIDRLVQGKSWRLEIGESQERPTPSITTVNQGAAEATAISWGNFNLLGDQKSIEEVRRLMTCEADLISLLRRIDDAGIRL